MELRELLDLITRSGVLVEIKDQMPLVGYAEFLPECGLYRISVHNFQDQELTKLVLQHELCHIVRGDLLDHGVGDPSLENIAKDVVINSGLYNFQELNKKLVISAQDAPSILGADAAARMLAEAPGDEIDLRGYDASLLAERFGVNVDPRKGWRAVYQALIQKKNDGQDQSSRSGGGREPQAGDSDQSQSGGSGFGRDGKSSDQNQGSSPGFGREEGSGINGDYKKVDPEHVAAARKALEKVKANLAVEKLTGDQPTRQELDQVIPDGMLNLDGRPSIGAAPTARDLSLVIKPSPRAAAIARAVESVSSIASRGGAYAYGRSYRREGREPDTRGPSRVRRTKVAVVFDVSGSMTAYLELGAGICEALANRFQVVRVAFANGAREITTFRAFSGDLGFGTEIQSAWSLIRKNHQDTSVVVLVSDMEIMDWEPRPSVPIVFVVVGGGHVPESVKRPGDVVIKGD